jgi:uncharacterized RDD family membrane protein YckC
VALHAPAPVATLTRRLIAFFLDGFILVPVYVVYAVLLDAAFGVLVEPDPSGTGVVVVAVDPVRMALELTLTLLTDAAYYAGCWARWGMPAGGGWPGPTARTATPQTRCPGVMPQRAQQPA